jgi:hypothetical protein
VTFGLGNRCSIRLSYGTALIPLENCLTPNFQRRFWLRNGTWRVNSRPARGNPEELVLSEATTAASKRVQRRCEAKRSPLGADQTRHAIVRTETKRGVDWFHKLHLHLEDADA